MRQLSLLLLRRGRRRWYQLLLRGREGGCRRGGGGGEHPLVHELEEAAGVSPRLHHCTGMAAGGSIASAGGWPAASWHRSPTPSHPVTFSSLPCHYRPTTDTADTAPEIVRPSCTTALNECSSILRMLYSCGTCLGRWRWSVVRQAAGSGQRRAARMLSVVARTQAPAAQCGQELQTALLSGQQAHAPGHIQGAAERT